MLGSIGRPSWITLVLACVTRSKSPFFFAWYYNKQHASTSRSRWTLRLRDITNLTNVKFKPAYSPKNFITIAAFVVHDQCSFHQIKICRLFRISESLQSWFVCSDKTWLTADDTAAKLEIIPSGYKLMNVALLYKETISVSMIKHSDNKSSSFEFSELSVKFGSFAARRPPNPLLANSTSYLESINLSRN